MQQLELPYGMYMCDISNNPLYQLRFRGEGELPLGRIQMNKTKLRTFDAKVKEGCEIDLADNPYLVNLSSEVEREIYAFTYKGTEFVDDGRYS